MKRVLVGGAFDLIHSAHIYLFQISKSFGDHLIVNIVPDIRVEELKGIARPILSELERSYIVQNIKNVDEVVCVHPKELDMEVDAYNIQVLREVEPDILVMSTRSKNIDDYCISKDIKFIVVPSIQGIDHVHSSDIISRIKNFN